MAKKEREYQHQAVQFDQMLYIERMDAQTEAIEKTNELLQKLVDAQAPKSTTSSKKATTAKEEKDEPAEDKKGE